MSSSNPGPVRRFFRGAWRVVDVSRRVVLNLLFLIILIAVIVVFAKNGSVTARIACMRGVLQGAPARAASAGRRRCRGGLS